MLRYKTETRPGLVALYDIRPGNGAGQFLQPRSLHGAPWLKISHILGMERPTNFKLGIRMEYDDLKGWRSWSPGHNAVTNNQPYLWNGKAYKLQTSYTMEYIDPHHLHVWWPQKSKVNVITCHQFDAFPRNLTKKSQILYVPHRSP